jgi:hypothetical protein
MLGVNFYGVMHLVGMTIVADDKPYREAVRLFGLSLVPHLSDLLHMAVSTRESSLTVL